MEHHRHDEQTALHHHNKVGSQWKRATQNSDTSNHAYWRISLIFLCQKHSAALQSHDLLSVIRPLVLTIPWAGVILLKSESHLILMNNITGLHS